ncbi:MAG: ATP-binding protein [Bacteroidales bacterium]|nr:ATP-binding protein [Bacteroidales bacterium]
MAEFQEISEKAKEVVGKFMSSYSVFQEGRYKILPVSLYALMSDADNAILEPLEKYRVDLNEKLDKKEITILKKEFPAAVRYCYEQYFKPYYLDSLIEICQSSVFTPKRDSKILLPYAGEARFIYDYNECSFDGYEPDSEIWAYSQILCSAYSANAEIQLGDSLENHEGEKYDYIFTMPYGRKDVSAIVEELHNMAEERLKDEGCLCCVLPARFCYAAEWQGLRKILIDKKGQYSAAVLSLPELLPKYTKNESVCVFWLYKGGDGKVILMDAKGDSFFGVVSVPEFYPVAHIKTQSIIETLEKGDARYVWYGSVSDLTGDVCLLQTRYLISRYVSDYSSRGKRLVRLDDIVELVEGSKVGTNNDGRRREFFSVSFDSLASDYLDCNVSPEKGSQPLCLQMPLWLYGSGFWEEKNLTESCLLAGFCNRRVKVGKFDNSSGSYCLFDVFGHEIIPFKLKSDIVSEDFLLRCLVSEEVEGQIEILPWKLNASIDSEDFLQIMISIPSKEEQERLCREDVQKSLEKADKKLQEFNREFRRDIHMKTHAMGQTIFALGGWLDVLQRARRENGGTISDDTVVGTLRQVTVNEIYDNLRKTFDHLQEQIYKMDRGNGLKKEDFALTTFLEEYIKNYGRNEFEFEYNAREHHHRNVLADDRIVEGETKAYRLNHRDWNSGDGEPIEYVKFSKEALTMVLDNIVSNACSHGFTDPDAKNIIKIEVVEDREDDKAFLIRVSNNGKPIDEKRFPIANVFNFGSSSASGGGEHFGLGGYEVKHLMWEFGGDAKIISTPSEEFTVCYELKLPKGNGFTYKKNA